MERPWWGVVKWEESAYILGWSGGAQVDKRRTSGEIIEDVGWEPNIGCIEEDNPLCWGIPSDCAFLSRDLHLQPPRLTELHEIAD